MSDPRIADPAVTEAIEDAAAWLALLNSGVATQTECEAYTCWRNASSAHARAYDELQGLWNRFDGLREPPARSAARRVLEAQPESGKRTMNRQKLIAPGVTVLLLGMLWLWAAPPTALIADYHTGVGEQLEVLLEDGSVLTLNTDSAVDVHFSQTERRLTLHQGEVLVTVAKDSQAGRPFRVKSRHGTAWALGTRFMVHEQRRATLVSVLESKVEVCAQDAAAVSTRCLEAQAGEQLRIAGNVVTGPYPITKDSASWARGQLVTEDAALADVLHELARYRPGLLRFDARELAGLRVSGVFPLDDTDQALQALADTLPVRVRHFTRWVVAVDRR